MILAYVPNASGLQIIVGITYAAVLCYGLISDIRSLKLPNTVSVAVLSLFFLNYLLLWPSQDMTKHLLTGGIALVLGFAIFAAGLIGAGDVKLISTLMVWAGPRDAYAFLIVMTLAGGLAAGLLLAIRKLTTVWPSTGRYIPSRRLKNWATRGIFPYGIAICTAGLILMPSFFSQSH